MKNEDVRFYEIPKTISEKDFLRTIVVGLGTSPETPSDVFNGKFGEIVCENHHFVSAEGSATVNCSASVGYDYEEEEFKYDHINKKYDKIMVTKTNWSPYQNTYQVAHAMGFCENKQDPAPKDAAAFRSLLKNMGDQAKNELHDITEKCLTEKGFTEVSEEIIKLSVEDMRSHAEQQCKNSLPGDRSKDFSAQTEVRLTSAANYSVPCHRVNYQYKGNTYEMHAFAHGSCIVRGSIPKAGEEKKSNMIGIAKAVSLGMSALLLVVALSFFVPAVLASIVAILATAVFVSYKVLEIYSKKNSNHNKVLNKKNAVEQILAANGLSLLDDEEKQKFKAMYKKGHKKQMTLSEAFAWVLYVMGIIMYFVNY